jgi:hypothetical protein
MGLTSKDGIFRLAHEDVLTVLNRVFIANAWDLPTTGPSDLQFNRTAETIDSDDPDLTSRQSKNNIQEWLNDNIFALKQSEDLFKIGFRWDEEDDASPVWWPQGVTGTADATESGELDGEKLLVVSWHFKQPEKNLPEFPGEEGARISVVKMTNFNEPIVYRHILLVAPIMDGGVASFTEMTEDPHAGGIVWFDHWLYVADGRRLLLFDINNVRDLAQQPVNIQTTGNGQVPTASLSSKIPNHDSRTDGRGLEIGWVDGRYEAFGYRYICPLVAIYTIDPDSDDSLEGHFSSIGLDRSTEPPRLVSAKFIDQEGSVDFDDDINNALLCFWELNPQTGLLHVSSSGHIEAMDTFQTNLRFIQGATAKGTTVWLSASSGDLAKLYVRHTDSSGGDEMHFWARGCESLTWSPHSNNLWSITEFENSRIGFAVDLSDVGG